MPSRKSSAIWEGNLKNGKGSMEVGDGVFTGNYSFGSRFEEEAGTNPEELIAAALAGCFSMALAGELGNGGFTPQKIQTSARLQLDKMENGFKISKIELTTRGKVEGITAQKFSEFVEKAKVNCPVSRALKGVEITAQSNLE
jgi:osmotically inducible protein OsmC